MKLTVHTFVSLDGVMQGPGGAEEDRDGGFERGGWMTPYPDQQFGEVVNGWFARAQELLLGRTTYEMMSGYWSQVTDPENPVGVALDGSTSREPASTTRCEHCGLGQLNHPEQSAVIVTGDRLRAARNRNLDVVVANDQDFVFIHHGVIVDVQASRCERTLLLKMVCVLVRSGIPKRRSIQRRLERRPRPTGVRRPFMQICSHGAGQHDLRWRSSTAALTGASA